LLPAIIDGDKVVGTLLQETRELECFKTSVFPSGKPIFIFHGCGDVGAVTLGAGEGLPNALSFYAYMGTSGWVASTIDAAAAKDTKGQRIQQSPGVFLLSHPCVKSFKIQAASCITAGGNIEWLRRVLRSSPIISTQRSEERERHESHNFKSSKSNDYGDEKSNSPLNSHKNQREEREGEKLENEQISYADLESLCRSSRPGCNGVMFFPWLNGERSPFTDPSATAGFLGIRPNTSMGDICRAIVEGICYSCKALIQSLSLPEGRKVTVVVVGGAGRSGIWMQSLSDILQCDVKPIKQSQGVGTLGAALMAAKGLKWTDTIHAHKWLTVSSSDPEIYTPNVETESLHRKRYNVYSTLYASLKQVFRELSQV